MRATFIAALATLPLAPTPARASCFVIGDSIAVGLGQALGRCRVDARVGIPSASVIGRVHPGYALTVISAGSNDPTNPRLGANLRAMRTRARGLVVWIVPHNGAGAAVRAMAAQHGDAAIGFAAARDGTHPASYVALAGAIAGRLTPGPRPRSDPRR